MAKNYDPGQDHDHKGGNRTERLLSSVLEVLVETECHNKTRHNELLAELRHRRKPRVSFSFEVGVPQLKANTMPLELRITNEQKVNVTVTPRTDSGKPAKLDGSPAWTVVSGNSQVAVAEDGLSADLISSDDPGDTVVLIKADADLGEGIEELADSITLSVVGATAKNLGLTAGAPVPKA